MITHPIMRIFRDPTCIYAISAHGFGGSYLAPIQTPVPITAPEGAYPWQQYEVPYPQPAANPNMTDGWAQGAGMFTFFRNVQISDGVFAPIDRGTGGALRTSIQMPMNWKGAQAPITVSAKMRFTRCDVPDSETRFLHQVFHQGDMHNGANNVFSFGIWEDNRATSTTDINCTFFVGHSGISPILNSLNPPIGDAEVFDRWNVWTAVVEPSDTGTIERPNRVRIYLNDRLIGSTTNNVYDVPVTAGLADGCFLMESPHASYTAQPEMEWIGFWKRAFSEDEIKLLSRM